MFLPNPIQPVSSSVVHDDSLSSAVTVESFAYLFQIYAGISYSQVSMINGHIVIYNYGNLQFHFHFISINLIHVNLSAYTKFATNHKTADAYMHTLFHRHFVFVHRLSEIEYQPFGYPGSIKWSRDCGQLTGVRKCVCEFCMGANRQEKRISSERLASETMQQCERCDIRPLSFDFALHN